MLIPAFPFEITFFIQISVSQFLHQAITKDEKDHMFEEKLGLPCLPVSHQFWIHHA